MGTWAAVPPSELQVMNYKDFYIAYVVCAADLVTSRNEYVDEEMQELFDVSECIEL